MINELIIIKLIPLKGKEIFSKIKNNDPMINNVLIELKLYGDKLNLDFKYIIFKKVKTATTISVDSAAPLIPIKSIK